MFLEVESLDPRIDICSAIVDYGYTLVMHYVERFVHHFIGEEIGVHGGYITCLSCFFTMVPGCLSSLICICPVKENCLDWGWRWGWGVGQVTLGKFFYFSVPHFSFL